MNNKVQNQPTLGPDGWQDVLQFWFKDLKPAQWFSSSNELDATINERFSGALQTISTHRELIPANDENLLACNMTSTHDVLAAIIVVDQFSRNIFRGSAEAFSSDDIGLSLSNYLIDTGALQRFETEEIQFAIMPQMHTETIEAQNLCVKLFEDFDIEYGISSAKEHRDLIERFGRFPHRNKVLGRASTNEEIEYLKNGSAFGQ